MSKDKEGTQCGGRQKREARAAKEPAGGPHHHGTAGRLALQAGPQHTGFNSFLTFLYKGTHLSRHPFTCRGKWSGENVGMGSRWQCGREGVFGGCRHPEAPALPGQTCHPWSMATPKDALCSVKLLCNSSLSPGLWRFCQWMSQSLRDRVPVLPLGTPIYIPVPFSVVCDNMPDCKPERPRPWHTSLSANCCEWRWDGKAFMSCSYTSKSGVPNPEAVAPISL